MPTAAEAITLYDESYFRGESGYVDYEADARVFRAEFRRRLRALRALGAHGRLLDVGCAAGLALLEAKRLGFSPSGLEPEPAMAARARARTGVPVLAASLEQALLQRGQREVVTCFDVLEHFVDPLAALRRMRQALVPGGWVAVTTPDFGGWWARVHGRRWPFITPHEHLHYFDRRRLMALFQAAGLTDLRVLHARTPASFATLIQHAVPFLSRTPRSLIGRGVGLPFGTLFLAARSASPSSASRAVGEATHP
jgi:2-polyprenyl-3-methyl-5-hydroxy-6-metoxy-1,4-benzoquinol methylase